MVCFILSVESLRTCRSQIGNVNLNQMLHMNNSLVAICFKKPQQCGVPEDMSVYRTPIYKTIAYLTQLVVVVVCDLLSNVIIAVFGSTFPLKAFSSQWR